MKRKKRTFENQYESASNPKKIKLITVQQESLKKKIAYLRNQHLILRDRIAQELLLKKEGQLVVRQVLKDSSLKPAEDQQPAKALEDQLMTLENQVAKQHAAAQSLKDKIDVLKSRPDSARGKDQSGRGRTKIVQANTEQTTLKALCSPQGTIPKDCWQ
jgi:multidrug resistance efflux pump